MLKNSSLDETVSNSNVGLLQNISFRPLNHEIAMATIRVYMTFLSITTLHFAESVFTRFVSLTECNSGINKRTTCLRNEQKENVLTTKTCFESIGFDFILLLFVVVTVLRSIMLTQNGQYLSYATIAFSETYDFQKQE
jgi:hypothetical protein